MNWFRFLFVRAENGSKKDPETTESDMPMITGLGRKPVVVLNGHQGKLGRMERRDWLYILGMCRRGHL